MDDRTDEILGITRCAQCGHRLEGEVDCPFCAAMRGYEDAPHAPVRHALPLWAYLTAMFLTFPLSLPWLVMSRRLRPVQKLVFVAVFSLCLIVAGLWFV